MKTAVARTLKGLASVVGRRRRGGGAVRGGPDVALRRERGQGLRRAHRWTSRPPTRSRGHRAREAPRQRRSAAAPRRRATAPTSGGASRRRGPGRDAGRAEHHAARASAPPTPTGSSRASSSIGIKKDGRSVRFMPAQDVAWLPRRRRASPSCRTCGPSPPSTDRTRRLVIKTLGKVLDRQDKFILDVARRIDQSQGRARRPPRRPRRSTARSFLACAPAATASISAAAPCPERHRPSPSRST